MKPLPDVLDECLPVTADTARRRATAPNYRVAVRVTHTIEVDVKAKHSRDAAHAAVDKLRTARIRIDGIEEEISTPEIVSVRARRID
jgi:hypothetical protein